MDLTSSQPQTEENIGNRDSSLNNASELIKIQKDRAIYPVPERFGSRWLGGWTAEVHALFYLILSPLNMPANSFIVPSYFFFIRLRLVFQPHTLTYSFTASVRQELYYIGSSDWETLCCKITCRGIT